MLKITKKSDNKIKSIMYIFTSVNLVLVYIFLIILILLYMNGSLRVGISYNVSNIVIIGFIMIFLTIFNLMLYNIYIYLYIPYIELLKVNKDLNFTINSFKFGKKQLDLERSKIESIVKSIPDGVIASSKDGNIFLNNVLAEKLLGSKKDALLGKFLKDIFEDKFEQDKLLPIEHAIKGRVISKDFVIKQDKKVLHINNTSSPIRLNGSIIGTVDILRDISIQKQTEIAQKEFVSLASHQLRTPITSIAWNIEELMIDPSLSKHNKEVVQDIHLEVKRMDEIIRYMLNLSRIDLGKLKFVKEIIDYNIYLNNLMKSFKSSLLKKNIHLEHKVNISKEITNDTTQLDIVIGNLISNAIKYSNMNSKISVLIEDYSNSKYRIYVKDYGIGIPRAQQIYIFGRLFRADNAKKIDTDGNGLGLYIVKKIVEAMKGDVWFTSKKDEGTEFVIELPYKI